MCLTLGHRDLRTQADSCPQSRLRCAATGISMPLLRVVTKEETPAAKGERSKWRGGKWGEKVCVHQGRGPTRRTREAIQPVVCVDIVDCIWLCSHQWVLAKAMILSETLKRFVKKTVGTLSWLGDPVSKVVARCCSWWKHRCVRAHVCMNAFA